MQFWNIVLMVLYLRLVRTQPYPANDPVPTELGGKGEENTGSDEDQQSDRPAQDSSEKDSYTYVALIEIVFTDGCRRTCTGAIIHENVVITAAHCFTMVKNMFLQPELSLSFIIIGTKHMFETGYEHYLPIERVVTHPRFKGWTADLALVFTFVSMNVDKPGTILPLASEKSTTPVDSNVTVISWGRCRADLDDLEGEKSKNKDKQNKQVMKNPEEEAIHVRAEIEHKHGDVSAHPPHLFTLDFVKKGDSTFKRSIREYSINPEQVKIMSQAKLYGQDPLHVNNHASMLFKTRREMQQSKTTLLSPKEVQAQWPPDGRRLVRYDRFRRDLSHDSFRQHYNLTTGIFGYVNLAACKKIVERTLPPPYEIKNKYEVLCYSSEEFYITNEDSGAPVIQGDELVAVTIGGVDSEGEHVAVGIRVSCFCTWIAENLPNGGGRYLKCGRGCDDTHHRHEKKASKNGKTTKRHTDPVTQPTIVRMRATDEYIRSYVQDKESDNFALAFRPSLHGFVNAEDSEQGQNDGTKYRRTDLEVKDKGGTNATTSAGAAVNLALY